MLTELNPHRDINCYINDKIAEEVENAYKKCLGVDTLYYYVTEHDDRRMFCSKPVWYGPLTLIQFIHKFKNRIKRNNCEHIMYTPTVTSAKNKSAIRKDGYCWDGEEWVYLYEDVPVMVQVELALSGGIEDNTYWIGDFRPEGTPICCDIMLEWLWNRVK